MGAALAPDRRRQGKLRGVWRGRNSAIRHNRPQWQGGLNQRGVQRGPSREVPREGGEGADTAGGCAVTVRADAERPGVGYQGDRGNQNTVATRLSEPT